ncbi:uncharacterized protein LOC134811865 [Bolinopsis microptera]|uniref:uncharacterized protein LOC134811865 n=1 Tax=Bolinopsis microptera TaxID=2820187 RepID=UPI00307A4572
MITFIVTLSLVCVSASSNDRLKVRALSFGRTNADYVEFQPSDMSPFSTSFTICSWMKRLHDASSPIVLRYYPGHVIVGDEGNWNYVNGLNLGLKGRFPEAKLWFHHCLSWVTGGTQRVYVNGVQLGSTSASADNLQMGGTIALGNSNSKTTNYVFGGQLLKLNWYSEELTSSQIRKMFEAGMCSTVIEEEYSSREIKWELILTKQRNGNVTEFLPTECATYEVETKLEETEVKLATIEQKLQEVTATLNDTLSELQERTTTLNDTVSELTETKTELIETKAECRESKIVLQEKETKLNRTEQKLQKVTETLNETLTELNGTKAECRESKIVLQEKETKLNRTEQKLQEVTETLNDTLTELNGTKAECRESKIVLQEKETKLNRTEQKLQEVTETLNDTLLEEARSLETVSRWDVLFTPPYLNKLFTRQLYNQLTNWVMMEDFIGVNVTVGLVKHFKQHHEEQEDHETCEED